MAYSIDKNALVTWARDYRTFKFHIKWSNNGVARVYIGDRKTPFYAGGYGYDKESDVIADMLNYICGKQNYDPDTYGNYNGMLAGGTGFDSIKKSFESIQGNKLEKLYYGDNTFNVYRVTFRHNLNI